MGNSQMAAQYGGLNHSHVAMQAPPPNSYRSAGPSQLHPNLSAWQNPTPSPAHWANLLGNYSPQTSCHLQPNLTAQFAAPMQQSFPGSAMGQAPLATPMAPSAFAQSRYPMHLPTSQSLSSNFMGSSFGQQEAYANMYHALNQQQTFYPPSIQQQPTGFSQGTNYGFAPVQPQFPSTPSLEPALFPGSQDFIAQPQTPQEYVLNTLESHEMGLVQMPTSSAMQVNYPPVAGPSRPAASLPSAPAPFEVTFVNYIPPVEPTTPARVKKTLQKPAKVAKIAKATNAAKPKNSRQRDENTDKVKQSLERKKVYQCDLCSQVCSSISDLKRHKESKIHSEKKYFCKVGACALLETLKSYTRIDALRRHWKKLPYGGGAGGLTMIRRKCLRVTCFDLSAFIVILYYHGQCLYVLRVRFSYSVSLCFFVVPLQSKNIEHARIGCLISPPANQHLTAPILKLSAHRALARREATMK